MNRLNKLNTFRLKIENSIVTYFRTHAALHGIPYWIAALVTGLSAVMYASAFKLAEQTSLHIFVHHKYALLATTPLCLFIGWWIVHHYAPHAKGSGIPQVMTSIELADQHKHVEVIEDLLGFKTIFIKFLSSIICVVAGGAIGREGPTIQISACIFNYIGKRFSKALPYVNQEFWLVTGGAAGIAAAFNTPLGGLVYGIEELAHAHFNKFKTSLIATVIVSGLTAQWFAGPYLYLGFPQINKTGIHFIPWAIIVGIICGFWGALFGKILAILTKRKNKIYNKNHLALIAILSGLILAMTAIFIEPTAFGPGKELIHSLLFTENAGSNWKHVLTRFIAPMITYLSGCAGGIFAPSLAAGSAMGSFIATLIHSPYHNLFVLLGMIAFLTGVTRAPFTAFVLVLEMTDRHSAIFLMMLSAVTASAIARLIDPCSFYEHMKHEYLINIETKHPV